jgi:1-acyl-sn-glycerol-3-phosphate acyltransferase
MRGSNDSSTPLAPSAAYLAAYGPVMLSLRLVLRGLAPRWCVTGRGHVPARGGVLLAPNHISDIDPPVVNLSLFRPLWFMAKSELFDIKILGPLIRFSQAFPVERGGADRAALRRAAQLLQNDQAVVVFPEGRLSQNGELQPLLPGVTMLALHAGVPIIPVGISGSNKVLPFSEIVPRPSLEPLRVHFGKPLEFSDLKELPPREQREQSTLRLEVALRHAIETAQRS